MTNTKTNYCSNVAFYFDIKISSDMYSGYSESSNCSDFIADLDDDSKMDLEGDGPIFSKKSYNCYYDKIEFEINRTFHAEYQNQITTL